MQTLQFARGLQRAVSDLKAREIVEFLQPLMAGTPNQNITQQLKDTFSTLMVQSIEGLAHLKSDPLTHPLIDSLKLPELYAATRIGKIWSVINNSAQVANVWQNQNATAELFSFLGMLNCLCNLSNGTSTLLEAGRLSKRPPNTEIVEFEIVDEGANGVDADRIRRFFEILIELHSQLAHFLKEDKGSFRIVYLDSGSAVVGAGVTLAIAERLKTLIMEVWRAIKYEPFDTFDRKLESVTKALTITKEIGAQIEAGTLPESDGKTLTRQIVGQAIDLINIGAIIPAADAEEEREQKKLLDARRTKMLASGAPANSELETPQR